MGPKGSLFIISIYFIFQYIDFLYAVVREGQFRIIYYSRIVKSNLEFEYFFLHLVQLT